MESSLKASQFTKFRGGHWPHDRQGHQRGGRQRLVRWDEALRNDGMTTYWGTVL